MNEVKINGTEYYLPASWSEVNPMQWNYFARYLLITQKEPSAVHRMLLAKQLLGIKKKVWNEITAEVKFEIAALLQWCEMDRFTTPIVPYFEHAGIMYMLPQDQYANVRILEYAFADEYYNRIIKDPNDLQSLNQLVATLCRPMKKDLDDTDPEWDGDPREKFSDDLMVKRAKEFESLAPEIKFLVIMQFIGCTDHIREQYKMLWPEKKEDQKWLSEKEKRMASFGRGEKLDFGWMGTLHTLVKTQWFGDWNKTSEVFLHRGLYHLCMEKAEHEEFIPGHSTDQQTAAQT